MGKPVLYLLLHRVKSQGHLALTAKPQDLSDCEGQGLIPGPVAGASWLQPLCLPRHHWSLAHFSPLPWQVTTLTSPEMLSSSWQTGHAHFLSQWYLFSPALVLD